VVVSHDLSHRFYEPLFEDAQDHRYVSDSTILICDHIVFYAYHGIKSNSNRPDAILRNLPYLGIAAVGLGSGVFHSTLKNYTQWGMFYSKELEDLPAILTHG
jgi:hypothetical protein